MESQDVTFLTFFEILAVKAQINRLIMKAIWLVKKLVKIQKFIFLSAYQMNEFISWSV